MGRKKIGFRGWLAALIPPTETAVVTTNSASGWGGREETGAELAPSVGISFGGCFRSRLCDVSFPINN